MAQIRACFMNISNFHSKKELDSTKQNSLLTNIDYDRDSKKVISFCVMQIHQHKEHCLQIIKYDAAHGYCHVHKYYENLNDFGQKLLDNRIGTESIEEFKNDIKQNWKQYLERYYRKWFKYKF